MKNLSKLAMIALLSAGLSACSNQASNEMISEPRQLALDYHDLDISIPAEVTIKVQPSPALTVEAAQDVLKMIDTRVKDGVLVIKTDQFNRLRNKVAITIGNPVLQTIKLSGATNVNMSGFTEGNLTVTASGANKIVAKGTVNQLKVQLSGAGNADLHELKADAADISVSGAGDVSVYCTKSLKASISGVGNISYAGKPAQVQKDISGIGKLKAI